MQPQVEHKSDLSVSRLTRLIATSTPGEWKTGYASVPSGYEDAIFDNEDNILCRVAGAGPDVSHGAYSEDMTQANAELFGDAKAMAILLVRLLKERTVIRLSLQNGGTPKRILETLDDNDQYL